MANQKYFQLSNLLHQKQVKGYYFLFGETGNWAIEKDTIILNSKSFDDYLFEDLKQYTTCTFDLELDKTKWNFSFWEKRGKQEKDDPILLLLKAKPYQRIQIIVALTDTEELKRRNKI